MKTMNRIIPALACGAAALFVGQASAQVSTFDTGLDGWTAVGFDFDIAIFPPAINSVSLTDNSADLVWDSGGDSDPLFEGNPGGFARFVDQIVDPASFLKGPGSLTGDLSGLAGQTIRYDHRIFNEGSDATSVGPYVIGLISGDPSDLNAYIYTQPGPSLGDADTGWVTISTTLDASNFQSIVNVDLGLFDPAGSGLTAAGLGIANGGKSFEQVLADVSGVFISFEMVDNNSAQVSEADGVDNAGIVPEPGSLALLGIGGLIAARRRRS